MRFIFLACASLLLMPFVAAGSSCDINAGGFNFDLSSLNRPGGYTSNKGEYMFRYQPCGGCEGECVSGAFSHCPSGSPGYQLELAHADTCNVIGNEEEPRAAVKGEIFDSGMMCTTDMCLAYKGGSSCGTVERNMIFMFMCSPTENPPGPVMEMERCQYVVMWQTPAGCKKGAARHHISSWWIFDILFFCVVFAYLGGGFFYRHKTLGLSGMEAIPNIDFWRELPNLVKDGCAFFWSKLPPAITDPIRKLTIRSSGYAPVAA